MNRWIFIIWFCAIFAYGQQNKIEEILNTEIVNWDYTNKPLFQIVDEIRSQYKINIVFEKEVTESLLRLQSDEINLQISGVVLKEAFEALLGFFDLVYTYRYDALFITYANSNFFRREARMVSYDIHELVPDFSWQRENMFLSVDKIEKDLKLKTIEIKKNTENFASLQKLVKNVITPQTWQDEKYSISRLKDDMFVLQSEEAQKDIGNLLQKLVVQKQLLSVSLQIIEVDNKQLRNMVKSYNAPVLDAEYLLNLKQGVREVSENSSLGYSQQFISFNDESLLNNTKFNSRCLIKPTLLPSQNILVDFFSFIYEQKNQKKTVIFQNSLKSFVMPLNKTVIIAISSANKSSVVYTLHIQTTKNKKIKKIGTVKERELPRLQKKLSLSYENKALYKVIKDINEKTQANVVIDPHIFSDLVIDEDSLRIDLKTYDLNVESTLYLIAGMLKLRYIQRNKLAILTTYTRYPEQPILKFYNIADIVYVQKQNLNELVSLIKNSIPKNSWNNKTGIGIWEGYLVVKQTQEVHDKIQKKLLYIQNLYRKYSKAITVWAFLLPKKSLRPGLFVVLQTRNNEKVFFNRGTLSEKVDKRVEITALPYLKKDNNILVNFTMKLRDGSNNRRSVNLEVENNTSKAAARISGETFYILFIGARITEYSTTKGQKKMAIRSIPKAVEVGKPFIFKVQVKNTGNVALRGASLNINLSSNLKHKSNLTTFINYIGKLNPGEKYIAALPIKMTKESKNPSIKMKLQGDNFEQKNTTHKIRILKQAAKIGITLPKKMLLRRNYKFKIIAKNSGNYDLEKVVLIVKFHKNTKITQGEGKKIAENTFLWNIARIQKKKNIEIPVSVSCDTPGNYCMEVTLKSQKNILSKKEYCYTWFGFPATTLEIKSSRGFLFVGEKITYRIFLKNNGLVADKNILVKLFLPKETKPILNENFTGKLDKNVIIFPVYSELKPGEQKIFLVDAVVKEKGNVLIKAFFKSDFLKSFVQEDISTTIYDR